MPILGIEHAALAMSLHDRGHFEVDSHGDSRMPEDLVALLRLRVTTRFYDRPQVIDAMARTIVRHGNGWLMAEG